MYLCSLCGWYGTLRGSDTRSRVQLFAVRGVVTYWWVL